MEFGRKRHAWTIVALSCAVAACGADASSSEELVMEESGRSTVPPHVEEHPPAHVDSIFPIEESLRRFREASGPEPTGLSAGAASRDALVERFVTALAAHDTAAFRDMLVTREEFGWLYYPHTQFTSRPYEMAPELLWFQLQNGSSRGLGRLLDRMGGTRLDLVEHRCAPVPLVEGPNRVWEGCLLRIVPPTGGEPANLRLFGSILERDGSFKFVSYSNDF